MRSWAQALRRYRNAEKLPYIHLLDGSVSDNLGVLGMTVSREIARNRHDPLLPRDAVRLRRALFIVVDAGRGPSEITPSARAPGATAVAAAVADTMGNAAIRANYDQYAETISDWRRDLISYGCSLKSSQVRALRGSLCGWNCRSLDFRIVRVGFNNAPPEMEARLNAIKTRLTLPIAQVDLAIEAGSVLLRNHPEYRSFAGR